MRVLALEPYHGGSHRAFLDGWIRRSRHEWTVLGLPANRWKWRMRHAPLTFAEEIGRRLAAGESWDLLFCSDMLNLAELTGLAPGVGALPRVVYFHENQLTYPVRHEDSRDVHFGLTNLTTCRAADALWFNSAYHRDALVEAIPAFLAPFPTQDLPDLVGRIGAISRIEPPGVEEPPSDRPATAPEMTARTADRPGRRSEGPPLLVWAARWEHDKDPATFFEAAFRLAEAGVDFRLSVLGESFREVPEIFAEARDRLTPRIRRWGYQRDRADYLEALAEADVFASTAAHEFFGLSAVEAAAAGCFPVLPRRLSYPEVFATLDGDGAAGCFYSGGAEALAEHLAEIFSRAPFDAATRRRTRRAVENYFWNRRAPALDDALDEARESTLDATRRSPAAGAGAGRTRAGRASGFSLIEALFALLVLGVALLLSLTLLWGIPRDLLRLEAQEEAMRSLEVALETVRAGHWDVQESGPFPWPFEDPPGDAATDLELFVECEEAATRGLHEITITATYRVLGETRTRRLVTKQWKP